MRKYCDDKHRSITEYDSPVIAFHGGECCGVKTIHRLGDDPDDTADELTYDPNQEEGLDRCGEHVSSSMNMYYIQAPEETYLERVDRYIKWLDAVRPAGIIEIILADDPECCKDHDLSDCGDHQVRHWEALLLERGFVCVSNCANSNSGNRIYVYHRCKDTVLKGEEHAT
jgi:hypothetical protein